MASMSSKLVNFLKKSLMPDAVPRAPRPDDGDVPGENNENHNTTNNQSGETVHDEDDIKKQKKSFFKPKKGKSTFPKFDKNFESRKSCEFGCNSTVNTQATGPVLNIINSTKVHCGENRTYYLSPVVNGHSKAAPQKECDDDDEDDDEYIEKNNLIILLMEAKMKLEHKYIEYVSQNLGRKWCKFFRALGFTKGRIETVEMDNISKGSGIPEARYQLLLEWSRNADDATLGRLANLLWEEGERRMVEHLSIIYSENKNQK